MDCDLMSLMEATTDYNYVFKKDIYISKRQ